MSLLQVYKKDAITTIFWVGYLPSVFNSLKVVLQDRGI